MPRRIVPIVAAMLVALAAGSLIGPGSLGLSTAQEGSPAATPASCPVTTAEKNKALARRF